MSAVPICILPRPLRVEPAGRDKTGRRVWDGDVLVAGTCRECGRLVAAEALATDRTKPGGRRLLCRPCSAALVAAYDATPARVAKQRARSRRAVESGREAEKNRRLRARRAARTEEEVLADQRRLRPDGLKKCRRGEWRPLADFPTSRANADGLNALCREHANAALHRAASPSWDEAGTYSCVYCGAPFEDVEHVVPAAHGGSDAPGNLAPSCSRCNRGAGGKSDLDPSLWLLSLPETPREDGGPYIASEVKAALIAALNDVGASVVA